MQGLFKLKHIRNEKLKNPGFDESDASEIWAIKEMQRRELWIEVNTKPSERAAHWETFMETHMDHIFGVKSIKPIADQGVSTTIDKGKKREVTEIVEQGQAPSKRAKCTSRQ